MFALLAYYLISHIVSFCCSIFESALLSCTPSYISLLKKKGASSALILEDLKSHIDKPLAAILTLNTIAHTFGAAGVGAKVVEIYGDKYLAAGSIILTLTMLYFTEMIPKTLGAVYWKPLIPLCARFIKGLIFITYPFVVSFNLFARFISHGKKGDKITEEEIKIALEAGTKAGVIEEAEQDMVENIFRLGDRRVGMLMHPRIDIKWLDVHDNVGEIRSKLIKMKHHRFPVCEGDVDEVVGVVDSRNLLFSSLKGEPIDLRTLATPPLFVQENQRIFELMDLFKKSQSAIALVTDEYGSIQGLITVGDILKAIVKDIEVGTSEEGPDVVKVNTRSFLIDGKMPIDEFKETFHIDELPDEEKARYRTISGLCMTQIGAIPKKGDAFTIGTYRFEVIRVRRRRVEKILLSQK